MGQFRKAMTIGEFVAQCEAKDLALCKQMSAGKARWGKWQFRPKNLTLVHRSALWYGVDLERCNSSAEVLDWLCQVRGKNWVSPEDIGYLLEAIDDCLDNLQSCMCSFGQDKPIDARAVLLARIKKGKEGRKIKKGSAAC